MRVCIVAASGKLGQYMVGHALDRGHDVVGVCREQSFAKLDAYRKRLDIQRTKLASRARRGLKLPKVFQAS